MPPFLRVNNTFPHECERYVLTDLSSLSVYNRSYVLHRWKHHGVSAVELGVFYTSHPLLLPAASYRRREV